MSAPQGCGAHQQHRAADVGGNAARAKEKDRKTGVLKLQIGKRGEKAVLLVFEGTVVKGAATGHFSGEETGDFNMTKRVAARGESRRTVQMYAMQSISTREPPGMPPAGATVVRTPGSGPKRPRNASFIAA